MFLLHQEYNVWIVTREGNFTTVVIDLEDSDVGIETITIQADEGNTL